MQSKIGKWIFLLGLVISVIVGALNLGGPALLGLAILGIIIGLLNITGEEVQRFLMATVALVIVGASLINIQAVVPPATGILAAFIAFVAGAALLVSLREIYYIAKS